jgi:S1-C subfamily serine protease
MNKKLLLTCLGLGALSIILMALPGSSARTQDCDSSTLARLEAKLHHLEVAHAVQASPVGLAVEEKAGIVQSSEDDPLEEQGDVQILLGSAGSWLGVETSEVTQEKEINGQRVEGTAQFRRMLREIPAGRPAQLTVWRDGRTQTISATLGQSEPRHGGGMVAGPGAFAFRMPNVREMPEIAGLGDLNNFVFSAPGQPRLGISAEDLQGDFGNYFGAPDGEGVLVRDVFADSAAAKAGLKAGDVITTVDGERIRTVDELREKLGNGKEAKAVKLGVLRNKGFLTMTVELPAPPQKLGHPQSHPSNL